MRYWTDSSAGLEFTVNIVTVFNIRDDAVVDVFNILLVVDANVDQRLWVVCVKQVSSLSKPEEVSVFKMK